MRKISKIHKNGRYFPIESEGNSMIPVIRSGDAVYFKKVNNNNFRADDIVLINKRDKLFTHRIIYKNKNFIVAKGDNNYQSDGIIYPKQIIGRVCNLKRKGQVLRLEDIYLIQSINYLKEIEKIKQAFENSKIDYVFLKGLPLNFYYAKSIPARIYADCDVLISKNGWEKASKILEKTGYRKAETSYSKIHHLLKDKPTEIVYSKKINDFPVVFDIHLEAGFLMNQLGRLDALYPQSLIDKMTKQFLQEKRIIKIQGELFPILSPPNLIIYLALHFFHHNYRGIFRLEFISKIIKKEYKGKNLFLEMQEKIRYYRLQNFVYPVFILSEKYYDLKLQKTFLDSVKPDNNRLRYIKENILNVDIFDGESRIEAGINRFKNLFFLSPYPLFRRFLIILNPQVIYSVVWVMTFFIRKSLIKMFRSLYFDGGGSLIFSEY